MNDISLSDYSSGSGWVAIGNIDTPFRGVFDGNNNVISDLYINKTTGEKDRRQGLFGYISPNSILRNIGIDNANINITSTYGLLAAGILAGNSYYANITNCFVKSGYITTNSTGSVESNWTGGLIGYAGEASNISSCYSNATVNATSNDNQAIAGGLFGRLETKSTLVNSYSTANIAANSKNGNAVAGGIAGEMFGNVENCYNEGNITGESTAAIAIVGGIAGRAFGEITNIHNKGTTVEGKSTNSTVYVGGLIGSVTNSLVVKNSSSKANIIGNTNSANATGGGFIAQTWEHSADIENSYATGNVTLTSKSGAVNASGFASGNNINIKNSYATGNVKGVAPAKWAYIGGFAEAISNNSTLENCYSTGNVYSECAQWALAGGLVATANTGTTIKNCYAKGNVTTVNTTGTSANSCQSGGLVGINYTKIINSYATGQVLATAKSTSYARVGALIASSRAGSSYTSSFGNSTVNSGKSICGHIESGVSCSGATLKTTTQLQTPSTFTSAGWSTSIWNLVQGQYPKLKGVGGQ